MEIILTLIVLIIIWCVAFLIGAKQGANRTINQIKKDGGYYDMEYTSSVYPILGPTSSLDEVPKEFLMGGDIDRALHIAGVKEATPAKIAEWQAERFKRASVETELSMDGLLSKLNKTDLQIKAGLIENTDKRGADIKIGIKETNEQGILLGDLATPKGYDPIQELKIKTAVARKEADKARVDAIKRNFEALPLSRLSVEGMQKIIELVREDIQNTMKVIEENTPEITEKKPNPKQSIKEGYTEATPFVKTKRKYTKHKPKA
jgi:hypothetical protein